jgi:DNA-binding MarR family transcriptional regulator
MPKKAASPTTPHVPLASRPGFLIRRLNQIHCAIFVEECKDFNLTPVQYGMLSAIAATPGLDQKALGLVVGLDRTNTADVLKRLEERGLVERRQDPVDGRAKIAFLTAEGKRITQLMYGSMLTAQERLMAPLPAADREQLLLLLRVLVDSNNEFGRASMSIL